MVVRNKLKYPALNNKVNLKSRADYIECDYIDGVKDEDGNYLIRPLTDEEKEFLSNFYEETIITNFLHDEDLKQLSQLKSSIINDETVQEFIKLANELNIDKSQIKKELYRLKRINKEFYREELQIIDDEIQEIRNETLLYPDKEQHKEFYRLNNLRNQDVFTRLKARGMLIYLDPEKYDAYYSEKIQDLDCELVLINELDKI